MASGQSRWLLLPLLAVVLLLLSPINPAAAKTIVETLPGFNGTLPFTLETGYVSAGDNDELQLFYFFIESARNPVRDPLLLWLTGGPGCSGFSGLVYEIGPLTFDYASFNGSLPSFLLNEYSWTQVASIIFLDAPVGTGFSYSETQEGYATNDTESASVIYKFLRKWLLDHPKFSKVPLYISGDSYSGMIVPQVALLVAEGNIAKLRPPMNLQGYILGNPVTELVSDENSRTPFAYRIGLLSDELYETAKDNCNGQYIEPNPNNTACMDAIQRIAECTLKICDAAILEPKCSFARPKPSRSLHWGRKFFDDDMPEDYLRLPSKRNENWCRNENYVLSYIWANDEGVQAALNVRNGTITNWVRCNKSLDYDETLYSSVPYHYQLMKLGFRALVYSGDHDMLIPYVGTQEWLYGLNMTVVDAWRPWYVNGQVAGYTLKSVLALGDGMTYNTVKGAGHTAPEYKPKECFYMIDRWLSYYLM